MQCGKCALVRWLLACLLFFGCPRSQVALGDADASVAVTATLDAGPVVTEARLAAWLEWQKALAALPASDAGIDAGDVMRKRARVELSLLADAGLTIEQADALEAVISAVVAERNVGRLSGADALAQFKAGLAQLTPEQRAKAEKAIADLQAKGQQGSAAVEAQFGSEAVRVVLTREAEVIKAWDALLASGR